MRKLLYFGCAALLVVTGCKKTGEVDQVNTNTSFSSSIKASSDSVLLAPANDNDTVLTINWPAVSYGSNVPVTYTLELDAPSDTAASSGWANAQKFVAGNNVLSYSFSGKTLNSLMQTLNYTSATKLVFRVLSDVNQYLGTTSSVPTVYSGAIGVVISPYQTNLYVFGAFQNWDPSTAPVIDPVSGYAGVFEGYVYFPGSGIQYFEYTNAPDTSHTVYGDGGGGTLTGRHSAASFSVPAAGYYEVSANMNDSTWTATATTWGIIGDATPGGWSNDTQLTYDPVNQVWTATVALTQAGSFKFRANGQWVIDFGLDVNNPGHLVYVDNPLFTYNPNPPNCSVSADGTYLVTLDLHISQQYTYTAVKQ